MLGTLGLGPAVALLTGRPSEIEARGRAFVDVLSEAVDPAGETTDVRVVVVGFPEADEVCGGFVEVELDKEGLGATDGLRVAVDVESDRAVVCPDCELDMAGLAVVDDGF